MTTPSGPWLRDTPGALFQVFRTAPHGLSRTEVVELTGMSRTAIAQRIDALLAAGVLMPAAEAEGLRGRPAERFRIRRGRGVILVADLGATGLTAAVVDADGRPRSEAVEQIDITDGPEAVLHQAETRFREMLRAQGIAPADVLGVGVSVPGPVDRDTGRTINPPIMTGWHDYDIPAFFRSRYGCPVTVEKDTNAMVFGEHRVALPEVADMVLVKIGTGIGTGLLLRGELYRGADGAAGDIGHTPFAGATGGPLCRCGNIGCIEAHAGGWALARDLAATGTPAASVQDVVAAVRSGNPDAVALVRRAAEIIGGAVSDIVNMVNPRRVVFAGQLAALDDLLAAARETIYRRSLPLATRHLEIGTARVPDAGTRGLGALVADAINAPAAIDALVTAQRAG